MGNCSTCIQEQQQRSQNRTSVTSASSFDNISHSYHRNRFTHIRRFSSYNLNSLIDETLLIVRTVADTDQEPPHAMLIVSRIANREDRWLEVVVALIERIPINDPLGATVIALLLDECSLLSKELLQQLIKRVCSNNRSRMKLLETIIDEHIKQITIQQDSKQSEPLTVNLSNEPDSGRVTKVSSDENIYIDETTPVINNHPSEVVDEQSLQEKIPKISPFTSLRSAKRSRSPLKTIKISDTSNQRRNDDNLHYERNTLVVLGCLAEKLVGPTSASMLDTIALSFLIDRVYLGTYGYEQLKSSDSDDCNTSSKYSCVLKIILFALMALEKFSHTSESKHILLEALTLNDQQTKINVLEYYEPWAKSNSCLQRQIGFYAQWLLDNVFILDYRRPSYETVDHHYINVMLNDKDVSEYLKIGPDGLEARSDTVSFESVRCTFNVNSGVWYYEVLVITDGVMQIGWATKKSKFMNHEGYGIGDDQYSIAYDGCRNLIWFGAKSIPHSNPSWKSGDIVGCLIDFDHREVIFSLNGRSLEPNRKLFSSTSNSTGDGYFAAASFMSYQHCRFNFGSQPFRYPPTSVKSFKKFNQYGFLSDDDKLILPKYKKLELLRAIKINDQDCLICVDLHANIIFKPCQHTGFCQRCAYKLDICPICRSDIHERLILKN
ncbi:unnamed protein product [Rotaria magnacalcarata]|uniref:Uncharacterized protein n=1 Tax=Rotaria magnacalcarata TaxID=392030 RepID=A0A816Z9T7_9BILA|nr:unnamed protein product [Rotaria magnacalcarata]CAF1686205.1 unnamed protein product [Rotaria magnacalcarata]CAF2057493.1 unnamed protein product [Rotaria magnacalcarata]CAF2142669.1 unnamed protein product [Rotaria magnacalcarata]CAF2193411.1 unnamed protein product [Rotaria magnacalcarata]